MMESIDSIAYLVVIPVGTGMDSLNHWIPAFACLQQAGRNDDEGNGHGPLVFNVILASVIIPTCLRRAGRNDSGANVVTSHRGGPQSLGPRIIMIQLTG